MNIHSNPGHTPLGHESTGAAGNDAGGDCVRTSGAGAAGFTLPPNASPNVCATPSPGQGAQSPGTYHTRADSLAQSVARMKGKPGVIKMRGLLYEARHTALAAELQGRA
ncbi:MAG: hypothetical protein ACPGFA_01230 [Pikeienuella sp.]